MLKVDSRSLADVLKRIGQVEAKIAKKALRTAARKGMNIVRDDVKANAPEDRSDDADRIKVKTSIVLSTQFRGSNLYVKVGIRGGAKKNPDTPYYWRMVEFGTKTQAAQPFMAPALEGNAEAVLERITEALRAELDRL